MRGDWEPPPDAVVLREGEVHVWRASLDRTPEEIGQFAGDLSADEQQRAARFRVPEACARFTAARAILRRILSCYLGGAPSALRFAYGDHGKPHLATATGGDVRFNLSHSHRLALYAIACGKETGIDLERVRPDRDHERLARRFFSEQEAAALLALPPAGRIEAFFQCWTRKEAYLKARGEGLAIPLGSFTVSFGAGQPDALMSVAGEPAETGRWFLKGLDAGPDYAAALAVEGPPPRLRFWDWTIRPGAPPEPPGS